MEDIAQKANVAKGTLYYNYSSKGVLFAAVVIKGINIIFNKINNNISNSMSSQQKLEVIIRTILEIYLQYENIASILINELDSGIDKDAIEMIYKEKNKLLQFVSNIIAEGVYNKELKNININTSAYALIGIIEGSLANYFRQNENYKIGKEQLITMIIEIFLFGIME